MARKHVHREHNGQIMISKGTAGSYRRSLHVPNGDGGPICHTDIPDGSSWFEKDVTIYPPGNKEWCEWCLALTFPEYALIDLSDLQS